MSELSIGDNVYFISSSTRPEYSFECEGTIVDIRGKYSVQVTRIISKGDKVDLFVGQTITAYEEQLNKI